MRERVKFGLIAAVFLAAYFFPVALLTEAGHPLGRGVTESLHMLHEYARDHVLLCLVPAFFIAGAISVFVSQDSVMRYLGPNAPKIVAYPVAAVSGTILAVCSCTVLPLFAGIHRRGAGLGPAAAFLYSGPAINVLAIILTARVLGFEIGVARAAGAVLFSLLIGLAMHLIFRREEAAREEAAVALPAPPVPLRSLLQNGVYFASMVGILVFANWGRPGPDDQGLFGLVFGVKWIITAALLAVLAFVLVRWFRRAELAEWVQSSWTFALQILPLLFAGVLVSGFLLGRPGHEALTPASWVAALVGGNSLAANLFASVFGALMYFATLTEVPVLQGLLGSGMGKGPALALLLAGPALSLPSMIVLRSLIGTRKTAVYVGLVVVFSTGAGMLYGLLP